MPEADTTDTIVAETSTHETDAPVDVETEVSYWPLFTASVKAVLVTVVVQLSTAVWFSVQFGGTASIQLWHGLPVLVITTPSSEAFLSITFWSATITAIVLAVYAVLAHRPHHRLQVQSGRSFAFLDICLLGVLPMISRAVGVGQLPVSGYHWNLAIGGAAAFAAAQWLVRDRYLDREALGDEAVHVELGDRTGASGLVVAN